MMVSYEMISKAAIYIEEKFKSKPEIGMILGSGLGILADEIKDPVIIPYEEIPHFPVSMVEGHANQLIIGELSGRQVLMMKGRFHLYEGYDPSLLAFPVRVMKELGINHLVVTNAAGGVNESFKPGDLMIIEDHINLATRNPLMGPNVDHFGPRFPDMSNAYNPLMRRKAKEAAQKQNLTLQEGVYAWFTGPSFETPAEIRMARTIGADAVGMSTVPEVLTAVHAGMKVLGISCITNMAAGILDQPLTHEEVMHTAKQVENTFKQLIRDLIKEGF